MLGTNMNTGPTFITNTWILCAVCWHFFAPLLSLIINKGIWQVNETHHVNLPADWTWDFYLLSWAFNNSHDCFYMNCEPVDGLVTQKLSVSQLFFGRLQSSLLCTGFTTRTLNYPKSPGLSPDLTGTFCLNIKNCICPTLTLCQYACIFVCIVCAQVYLWLCKVASFQSRLESQKAEVFSEEVFVTV